MYMQLAQVTSGLRNSLVTDRKQYCKVHALRHIIEVQDGRKQNLTVLFYGQIETRIKQFKMFFLLPVPLHS